ncbi:enoyl-[acyl-carrier-protein] reductase [NADH] [Buchnera aphidicola (Nipponaphis monzeni)]|uniref:Enoyl-[acyl-carrier-protein] reductase [NADH] n=1 Tax=Buchnera aphidicola (Nipponaphis monzeni) TaxID=2495405 RepID=A0A455TAA5_9GAMM|nr:enoyl-ACP reductase [Buchnera aphidicola]BBI01220.1 enoyl-[acyl-carrier-protein] reductase [NADH] [Buchnera aphidicola (Nipponaphis monzeni)]
MGFLKNKRFLITGITNEQSIAFGIAKSMYLQEAELAFTYKNLRLKSIVTKYAKMFNSKIVIPCNVIDDKNVINLFDKLSNYWEKFDGFVHSIAFVYPKQLQGNYIDLIDRKAFTIAHEINSYSFVAMVKNCKHMLNKNSSIITLSYIGSKKIVPNYNIMGIAKASLECNMRYVAYSLRNNQIRVNAISVGPIKTLASSFIKDFTKIKNASQIKSLIKRNVTIFEIGNIAAFLCSNLSSAISGQVIYADGGSSVFV